MADRVDAATRSRIMRAIKGSDTKPELALAAALQALGAPPFARPPKTTKANGGLPGSPDIVFEAYRLAVFVHGCWWHCCPRHFRLPGTRTEAWREHFARNVRRDRRVRRALNRLGWRTAVVWEHVPAPRAALRVVAALQRARQARQGGAGAHSGGRRLAGRLRSRAGPAGSTEGGQQMRVDERVYKLGRAGFSLRVWVRAGNLKDEAEAMQQRAALHQAIAGAANDQVAMAEAVALVDGVNAVEVMDGPTKPAVIVYPEWP
jgi:DNA mismatch endonuclease, patch repair protein